MILANEKDKESDNIKTERERNIENDTENKRDGQKRR